MQKDLADLDVFFISYDEPRADEFFQEWREIFPRLKRVHGVQGELNAWITAARKAEGSHFLKIDGDCTPFPNFSRTMNDFSAEDPRVHIWRSLNAVNGLIYGFGSMQLHSCRSVLAYQDVPAVDPTILLSQSGFVIEEECASSTSFNETPFFSFRSAFRECFRIASRQSTYFNTPYESSIQMDRLKIWSSLGRDAKFGTECLLGARMGALAGFQNPTGTGDQIAYEVLRQEFEGILNEEPEKLLAALRTKLLEEASLEVLEISSEESRFFKTLLYSSSRDLVTRLNFKCRSQAKINY